MPVTPNDEVSADGEQQDDVKPSNGSDFSDIIRDSPITALVVVVVAGVFIGKLIF